MVDPVFVDTSEGRAVIADSLKPQYLKIVKEKIEAPDPKKTATSANEDNPGASDINNSNDVSELETRKGICINFIYYSLYKLMVHAQ